MSHKRALGLVLGFFILAGLGWARPVILLSQARERSMYVSVVDQAGAPAPNLGPSDFVVREDNVSREVLRVAPANEPMQIAILVDNSTAARNDIPDIRRALPGMVDALVKPADSGRPNEVAIIGLADRPTILVDYTSDRVPLGKAIDRVWDQAMSGNYLLDAVVEVTRGLKKREATRPVIVVITTTEGPEFSTWHYPDVLAALRDSNAAFHVITLGLPSSDIGDQARSRDVVIEQGPPLTGGVREQLLTSMALPLKLQQLANVLTHQYRVTYAHPDSLIPPERVTVSAKRADLTARGTLVQDKQGRQ